MPEHTRNQTIDILRGIAILLVVMGHTLTGCGIVDATESILFCVIWALQMPLFMLISGYVAQLSKPVDSGKVFLRYLGKRSLSYLLPWAVWTVGINGFLRGNCTVATLLPYVKNIVMHMDSGYWFLVSLWTICVIFALSQWFSARAKRPLIWHLLCTAVLGAALAALALWQGTGFLGLRYTLYYLPFFYLGWLFHRVQKAFESKAWYKTAVSVAVGISVCWFCVSVARFNSFSAGDGVLSVLRRAVQSLTGCIAVSAAVSKCSCTKVRLMDWLRRLGTKTLELYLVHNLFLCLLKGNEVLRISTVSGLELVVVNFALTLLLSLLLVGLAQASTFSNFILFAKQKTERKGKRYA